MSSLRLVLAWVCDPAFGKAHLLSKDEDARYWNALDLWVGKATQIRQRVGDATQQSVRFTWLVRADAHIASLHGDASWCLSRFSSTWSRLHAEGDSLGWVFYPAIPYGEGWMQAYGNGNGGSTPAELLADAYASYRAAWDAPEALLMGWHGHTQATMKQAAELGIGVDLSAIPGWYTIRRGGVAPPVGGCDWEITPNAPYYPSAADYRRPVVYPNEPAQDILELPWSLGAADWRCFQQALLDLSRPGNLGLRRNYRRRRQGITIRIGLSVAKFRKLVTPLLEKAKSRETPLTILCQPGRTASSGFRRWAEVAEANLIWLGRQCRAWGLSLEAVPAREARNTAKSEDLSKPIPTAQHGAHEASHHH